MSEKVLTRTRRGFITEKRCTGCLRWLLLHAFDKDPRRRCGRRNDCKQCRKDKRCPRARNWKADYARRKARAEAWKVRALAAEETIAHMTRRDDPFDAPVRWREHLKEQADKDWDNAFRRAFRATARKAGAT